MYPFRDLFRILFSFVGQEIIGVENNQWSVANLEKKVNISHIKAVSREFTVLLISGGPPPLEYKPYADKYIRVSQMF